MDVLFSGFESHVPTVKEKTDYAPHDKIYHH